MKAKLLLACAGVVVAAPALAATPVISGRYALSYVETCQATFSYSKANGDVTSINSVISGRVQSQMMLALFNAANHRVSGSGFSDEGDLLIIKNLGGKVVKEVPWTLNSPYSNTATQVTIGGSTFRIVYSNIVSGIAHHADFTGIPSAGCVGHGTADRQ